MLISTSGMQVCFKSMGILACIISGRENKVKQLQQKDYAYICNGRTSPQLPDDTLPGLLKIKWY